MKLPDDLRDFHADDDSPELAIALFCAAILVAAILERLLA